MKAIDIVFLVLMILNCSLSFKTNNLKFQSFNMKPLIKNTTSFDLQKISNKSFLQSDLNSFVGRREIPPSNNNFHSSYFSCVDVPYELEANGFKFLFSLFSFSL